MKFAFLSLQFKRWPLERSFAMAAKYGFEGVEIWGARPHAYPYDIDAEAAARIRGYKQKYGIQVPMYTPELLAYPYNLASDSEKERMETIAYLKQSVLACEAMECPAMLVTCDHPGYGRDPDEAWSFLVRGLQEVSSFAQGHNIHIFMESLGPNTSPIVSRSDDLNRLIKHVNSPAFGAMLDMAIPPLVAEPMSEYVEKINSGIGYVHVCGCDGIYETHLQVAEGSGTISFAAFFDIMNRCGYDGWYSIEILDPYFRDPELYLAETARYLQTLTSEYC